MIRSLAVLALAALIGCATAPTGRPASQPGSRVSTERVLCILDQSASYGAITVRVENGPKFNPWSGKVECKNVYVPTWMLVTSIGGGLNGSLRERMEFKTTDDPCMVWVIMGLKNRDGDGEQRFVPCHWVLDAPPK